MKNIMRKIGHIKKYFYYNQKRTELSFYPDRIYLELTNHCNFQCIMCPNGRGLMKRERGFIDYNLCKNIIDEMAPHVDTIVLHSWGESLLHPRIFEIIKYCGKHGVRTELSTNTSLLNEDLDRKIIDSGLSMIYLCIDGVTKDTYERIRKNGDYEKSVNNVEDFLNIKKSTKSKKPFVNLQTVIMKETSSDIENFKKKWSVEGVDKINLKPLDTWGGQISEINQLNLNESNENKEESHRPHCPNLWYHAYIFWDGSLVCCERDFDVVSPIGNVKDGVMKVWNGPKMQELRRKHVNLDLEDVQSCRNCNECRWWKPTLFSSWGNIPQNTAKKASKDN